MSKVIKLIGNPHSVYDGEGDFSIGYFQLPIPEFCEEDVKLIIKAYADNKMEIDADTAYYAWDCFSASQHAHWLNIKSYDIVNSSSRFLIVEPE